MQDLQLDIKSESQFREMLAKLNEEENSEADNSEVDNSETDNNEE